MKNKNSFIVNSIMNFGGNIINILLGLLSTIMIARTLGAELQGIYTLLVLLPSILVTFMNLGIAPATVYSIGKKHNSINKLVGTNIVLSLIISLFSMVLGAVIILLFKDNFFENVPIKYLFIVLSVLPFLFLNSFLQAVYQGKQNFKRYNEIVVYNKLIQAIVLGVVLIVLKLGLVGAIISFLIASILPTTLILIYFRKDNYRFKLTDFSWNLSKEYLIYGYKAHLSNIVSFLNYRMDILMISFFLNPASVGIYNVAVSIAERLWVFSSPISAALFPRISTIEDESEKNLLTVRVAKFVFYISGIIGIILFALSPFLIRVLFGIEYIESSRVIRILLVGITIFSMERILSNYLAGKGLPELNLYTSIFTVIINIIFNIILIPRYGISGAAISTSISYISTSIIKVLIFKKVSKARIKELFIIRKSDIYLIRKILNNKK